MTDEEKEKAEKAMAKHEEIANHTAESIIEYIKTNWEKVSEEEMKKKVSGMVQGNFILVSMMMMAFN